MMDSLFFSKRDLAFLDAICYTFIQVNKGCFLVVKRYVRSLNYRGFFALLLAKCIVLMIL